MPQAFFYGIVVALAFIGFIAIMYMIILQLFRTKGNGKYVIVLHNNANKDEIENLIYGAHIRGLLFGNMVSDEIILLDCGLDTNNKKLAEEVSLECGSIQICDLSELENCICGKGNDGTGVN